MQPNRNKPVRVLLLKPCGLFLLLMVLFASSCRQTKQQDKELRTFRINFSSGSLESLDPAYAKDLYTMWTTHMVYNTLVETDEQLHIVPSLARSWDISDDGLRYTFHLRDDVYFQHNPAFPGGKGRKMVAADLVYSFARLIDPAVASSGAWIFNDRVDSKQPFTAVDDSTFEIRLKVPFRPLLPMLSMPYCSVVPHEVVTQWGKDYRRHPCGTGPFQYFDWDEGNVLLLHKNPGYWERDSNGKALPYMEAAKITFFDSKATEFLLFLQHRLDFVNGLDGSFKDLVLSKNGTLKDEFAAQYRLTKNTYLNTEYIGMLVDTGNVLLAQSPTRYKLVRQAINYAIDRKRIATYFRNGIGIPATGGFIPGGLPGNDSTGLTGYHYDPEKAQALLAKAGFPNGRGLGTVSILTPDNWADIVNFIATQLADIGIRVKVEVMQPNILRQQMSSSKAVAFRGQWIADYPDAETFLAFFNSRFPAPPNYTRFNNATFDKWYDESMNLPDTQRWLQYRKMDSLVMSEAPVIPLFYDQLLHFTQLNVNGFSSNPMNLIDIKRVQKQ
jgi:oligopeptide transport system substrate-binding protein